MRHDGGDAETGTGVEVGAGLRYTLGSDSEFEPESRLEMDVGYGFGLPGNRGVLTPYAGMTLGDARARTVRTGTR